MSGPTRRLFVAVDLPASLARRLVALVPAARGVRPVPAESLHLTLHFLGDVPTATIPDLCVALDQVQLAPFTIGLEGQGRFPPHGPARVLWVGIAPQAALAALHVACGRAITAAGLSLEARPFTPHVTVARLTEAADQRIGTRFLEAGGVTRAAFPVERIVLYASERTPFGPRHEPLHVVPLQSRSE